MSVTLGLILVEAPKPKYYCQNTSGCEHTIKSIWVDTKTLLGMFTAEHNKWETSCLTKEKISLCNVQSQRRSILNDTSPTCHDPHNTHKSHHSGAAFKGAEQIAGSRKGTTTMGCATCCCDCCSLDNSWVLMTH